MYHAKCPSELCDENDIGESGRRIAERVKNHNGTDHKSHILKHSLETGHEHVKSSDFSIESLLIKQLRPTLNIHDISVLLNLFN